MNKRPYTVDRPYLLISVESRFPLSSEEAQRLIDSYLADGLSVEATANRVDLRNAGTHAAIIPATLGGGPAFTF